MKKKLLVLLTLFAFMPFVNAEEYLVVDRDTQSSGVETTTVDEEETWELFYNAETKKFQVVYNITNEAPDEITLDLTNALNLLTQMVDGRLEENKNVQTAIEKGYKTTSVHYGGASFKVDIASMKSSILVMPGDSIVFTVTIKNNSGKTYVYKEDSLVIATPKQPETESEIVAFDGQKIDKELSTSELIYGFNDNLDDHNIVNALVDRALQKYPIKSSQYYIKSNGELTKDRTTHTLNVGDPVVLIGENYYFQIGNYYIKISKTSSIDTTNNTIKSRISGNSGLVYDSDGNEVYSYLTTRKADYRKVINAFVQYIVKDYNGDDEKAIIDEFNAKYNTSYKTLDDFTKEDLNRIFAEISQTYMYEIGALPYSASVKYDNFYKNNLSAVITTEEEYNTNYDVTGSWSTKHQGQETVGKYMDEKVNGVTTGKYKETDTFLTETIGEVKDTEDRNFVYGINIDGLGTNNNYMSYRFGIYTSIKMVAKKGVVIINYVDENGKPLKESETVEYYYYEDYETKASSFEDYELIEVEGLEKGTIEQDETVVTYIYQFTSGQGNDEPEVEPKKELVQTGSEVDYSIMTSAFITISLIGLAIYTHKKQN